MRRRFFATQMEAEEGWVEGDSALHLARVLRAQSGQEFEFTAGGRVVLGRLTEVGAEQVRFQIVEELPDPVSTPEVVLAVALFKFARLEWLLEKATEMGCGRVHLLQTRRTDAHLAAAAAARLPRWRKIATAAAQQSRQSRAPEIVAVTPLEAYLAAPGAGHRYLLSELPVAGRLARASGPVALLIGPEGGFAAEEFEAMRAAAFTPVWLGPRILRCETAALAGLALLTCG